MTTIRPPVPLSCADRPLTGGLVIPYVNVELADGGADFRSRHQSHYEECIQSGLCQVCARPLGNLAVLFGGASHLRRRHFDEPPLCPPCALYASQACPMIAGRQERFASRETLTRGHRGQACSEPGCDCGGWTDANPGGRDNAGQPAHPWYAAYARNGSWTATGEPVTVRCSDRGCEHERLLINGVLLLSVPVKTMLVSEPGKGRV